MQHLPRLTNINRFGSILLVIALLAGSLLLQPDEGKADVLAQGELRVLAVGSGVNPEIQRTEATGTESQDVASVSSDYGATNSASYLVSIDRARIESSVSGDNGDLPDGSIYYPGAYNGFVDLELHDDLRFTVPAGSYPSGVTATLDAGLAGSLSAGGGAGTAPNRPRCQGSIYISFHSQSIDRNYGQLVGGDPPIVVDESVALVVEIVPPGTTYASETLITRSLVTRVDVQTSMNVASTAHGSSQASLDVTFSRPVVSHPSVGWDSSSGVFGSQAPQVPGLGFWGQVLVVVLMLMLGYGVLSRRPGGSRVG